MCWASHLTISIDVKNLLKTLVVIVGFVNAHALAQDYVWRTMAGGQPGGADGTGSQAQFYYPYGITSDTSGNLYVADDLNHTVRKVLPNGTVTTLAGKAGSAGAVNGLGALARFNRPSGVALDSRGNLYVCERGNHCIRKISPSGEVSTFAGMMGFGGSVDGSASQARFRQPRGIAVDANNNIFVADSDNHTIRKILSDGTVSTLAGLSQTTGSSDGLGGLARFNLPTFLCVSSDGNLFVADTSNHTIRKVTIAGEVTTFAGLAGQPGYVNGNTSVAKFNRPSGVFTTDAGDIYVSDSFNGYIRKITSSGDVTAFCGDGVAGWVDGSLDTARFWTPLGITITPIGEIFITDSINFAIRKIGFDNMVTTLAGRPNWGDTDGNAKSARFNFAASGWAVAVGLNDSLYIADSANFAIRQIQGLEVTTVAGMKGVAGNVNGPAASAGFGSLHGIACDALGNIYVSQANSHLIRKLSADNQVTTVAGAIAGAVDGTGSDARFRSPFGLAVDTSNRVLIADRDNHAIRRMTPEGVVTTIAGTIGTSGTTNGPALSAQFNAPQSVAVDLTGLIYVADTSNHCIRRINLNGNVETFAGLAGTSGYVDGSASVARFNNPVGVATDTSGNVYVAEGNARIRKITPSGSTTTIGRSTGVGYSQGIGSSALFHNPARIAVDSQGLIYVPDSGNHRIVVGGIMPFQEVLSPEQTVMEGDEGVIAFGQSILGRTSIKEITLKNRGTSTLAVQCAFLGANASEFSLAGGLSSVSVAAGAELKLTIQHTPLGQQGERAASLRLTSNDVIQPDLMISLGSTAIDPKPFFSLSPVNAVTKNPRQSMTFAALYISGLEPFTYRWRRNGVVISGATGSSYTIASVQQSHEGNYDCVISNTYGSFTTSASFLTVNDPVVIVTAPLSQAANVGQEVTLSVNATGTGPIEYQWRKNGTPLAGENAPGLVLVVDADSGGFYDVVVTNPLGSVTSTTAALTVLIPPVITLQPLNQDVSAGSTAFFSVTASGPDVAYQWRRNGVNLRGQTGSMLIVTNVQTANEGVYEMVIRNRFGTVVSLPALLTLQPRLVITDQPESVSALPGETVEFTVAAVGPGVLTYQWFKDSKRLPGATAASLTLAAVDASTVGSYSVAVASGKLKQVSSQAQLRIEDEGLLIYRLATTGTKFEGTHARAVKFTGLLILDQANQRGGFIRYGSDGNLRTFVTKLDEGLRTQSTGPVPRSQTVVSKVLVEGSAPAEDMASFWLRGTDGMLTFSPTDRTVAPRTLKGFQVDLRNTISTEVETLNVTAILDPTASLQARQANESIEQTLNRLAASLQQQGVVRR